MAGLKGLFNRFSKGNNDSDVKEDKSEYGYMDSEEYCPLKKGSSPTKRVLGGVASIDGPIAGGVEPSVVKYLNRELDGADRVVNTESGRIMAVRFIYSPDEPGAEDVHEVLRAMEANECDIAVLVSETGFTDESVDEAQDLDVLILDYDEYRKGDF